MHRKALVFIFLGLVAAASAFGTPTGSFTIGSFLALPETGNGDTDPVWSTMSLSLVNGNGSTSFNFVNSTNGVFASGSNAVDTGTHLYWDNGGPFTIEFTGPGGYWLGYRKLLGWKTHSGQDVDFYATQFSVAQTAPQDGEAGFLNINFFGVYHGFDGVSGLAATYGAQVSLSLAQVNADSTKMYSGSVIAPPAADPPFEGDPGSFQATPEPATMGLLGSALVGLGLFGRRALKR